MDAVELIVPRWYLAARRAGVSAGQLREQVQQRMLPGKPEEAVSLAVAIYEEAIAASQEAQ